MHAGGYTESRYVKFKGRQFAFLFFLNYDFHFNQNLEFKYRSDFATNKCSSDKKFYAVSEPLVT